MTESAVNAKSAYYIAPDMGRGGGGGDIHNLCSYFAKKTCCWYSLEAPRPASNEYLQHMFSQLT